MSVFRNIKNQTTNEDLNKMFVHLRGSYIIVKWCKAHHTTYQSSDCFRQKLGKKKGAGAPLFDDEKLVQDRRSTAVFGPCLFSRASDDWTLFTIGHCADPSRIQPFG